MGVIPTISWKMSQAELELVALRVNPSSKNLEP